MVSILNILRSWFLPWWCLWNIYRGLNNNHKRSNRLSWWASYSSIFREDPWPSPSLFPCLNLKIRWACVWNLPYCWGWSTCRIWNLVGQEKFYKLHFNVYCLIWIIFIIGRLLASLKFLSLFNQPCLLQKRTEQQSFLLILMRLFILFIG